MPNVADSCIQESRAEREWKRTKKDMEEQKIEAEEKRRFDDWWNSRTTYAEPKEYYARRNSSSALNKVEIDTENDLTIWIKCKPAPVKNNRYKVLNNRFELINQEINERSVQMFLENDEFMKSRKNCALFWSAPKKTVYTLKHKSKFWEENVSRVKHSALGLAPYENIAQVIAEHFGFTTISDIAKDQGIDINTLNSAQWRLLSGPYAKRASGIVFAAIRENYIIPKNSTWENVELPELMKNKKIDMIVGLRLSNPNSIKSIWLPNGIDTKALEKCTFPLPMSIFSDDVKSKFPDREGITIKQLSKEFKDTKIKISPVKVTYNKADTTIKKVDFVNERGEAKR